MVEATLSNDALYCPGHIDGVGFSEEDVDIDWPLQGYIHIYIYSSRISDDDCPSSSSTHPHYV